MTDRYSVEKFNQRVEHIEYIDSFSSGEITDTAINKRREQLDKSFENGSTQTIHTYNELQDILDEIEN